MDDDVERSAHLVLRSAATVARRRWLVSFVLFFLLGAAWAGAGPLLSGSDEGAHAIKAAAVVRGELHGARTGPQGRPWLVHVPGPLARAQDPFAVCYLYAVDRPGSCGLSFSGPTANQAVTTQFGAYPPLYYLVVGLPSIASPSALGIYLMRLISVAITSAFLASALTSALACRRSRMLVVGLGIAIVPIVIYLGAVITDSGLEISAAICLWVSALVYFVDPPAHGDERLLTRAGISASALVLARPLSPLWLAVIALTIMALCPKERARAVLKRRDARIWAGIVTVATGLALVWTLSIGVSIIGYSGALASWSRPHIASVVLGDTGTYIRQMVGLFSFDNVAAPLFTFVVFWTLAGLLVMLAVVVARRRQLLVLIALVGATVLLPVAIDVLEAGKYGYLWQGRYSLPLAIGIPLLAAFTVGRESAHVERRYPVVTVSAVTAIVVAHIGAFTWFLRHFMWSRGQWSFLHSQWEPPIPGLILVICFGAVAVAYGWWLHVNLGLGRQVVPPKGPVVLPQRQRV
jgi:hypothetical protein